ncbi:MAG: hypothetical protein ACO3QC_14365 [Phycisphaerales bacterium]
MIETKNQGRYRVVRCRATRGVGHRYFSAWCIVDAETEVPADLVAPVDRVWDTKREALERLDWILRYDDPSTCRLVLRSVS